MRQERGLAALPSTRKYCTHPPTHLSFLIIPRDPSLLFIRAPAILRSGSIRSGQKLVTVLVLRVGSMNSSSPRGSPCHPPSSMEPAGKQGAPPRQPALLPCTPPDLYLAAHRPSLSISVTVLPQQVQGCAQQQDRNGGQSQDHQRVLYHFLGARRARQPTTHCICKQ